jgi:hypothetical protein
MSNTLEVNNDLVPLKTIKSAFNEKFPHLRIEFFSTGHKEGQGSSQQAIYDDHLRLADIRKEGMMGEISIHGNLKTSSLEKMFQDQVGVAVQVYRKSGNVWLQTTATDDWTLSEQEKEAAAMNVK